MKIRMTDKALKAFLKGNGDVNKAWSKSEDEQILETVKTTPNPWRSLAVALGRSPPSCLARYDRLASAKKRRVDGELKELDEKRRATEPSNGAEMMRISIKGANRSPAIEDSGENVLTEVMKKPVSNLRNQRVLSNGSISLDEENLQGNLRVAAQRRVVDGGDDDKVSPIGNTDGTEFDGEGSLSNSKESNKVPDETSPSCKHNKWSPKEVKKISRDLLEMIQAAKGELTRWEDMLINMDNAKSPACDIMTGAS